MDRNEENRWYWFRCISCHIFLFSWCVTVSHSYLSFMLLYKRRLFTSVNIYNAFGLFSVLINNILRERLQLPTFLMPLMVNN